MRSWRLIPIALAIVAAACASPAGSPSDGDDDIADPGSPDGAWQLASGVPLVAGYPITLTVDGYMVSGTAACNGYGGAAQWGDGTVAIPSTDPDHGDMRFHWTDMGCQRDVMAAQAAYFEALFDVAAWHLDDSILYLMGDGIELVFEPIPVTPTADLVGTSWELDTLIRGDAASTVSGDPATLVLFPDGSLQGSTGCRTLYGEWIQSGAEIRFTTFGADGTCTADLESQDGLVVEVLGDGFRPEVDGEFLTVWSVGDLGLRYHATEAAPSGDAEPPPPEEDATVAPLLPELYTACGHVVLDGGLNPQLPFAPLSDEGVAATTQYADETDSEFAFFNHYTWTTAEETPDTIIVFGRPLPGGDPTSVSYADARFERREDAWEPSGWGTCHVTVEAEGWGVATWQFDPAVEPDQDSSQIAMMINERECANGEPPIGREIIPVVIADEDRIELVVLVEPLGMATCPSNPWHPVVLDIGESPDGRPMFDASETPAEQRTWPPGDLNL